MATTTNYSWTTPDDTALVKDGAAAIRSLGTAIDTTVFNNASAAVAKATVDAKGDLIAGTADDTIARLAVGANGSVLTAASGEATGLQWATPGGGITLIQETVASADTSISFASIPATYKNLVLTWQGLICSTSGTQLQVRANGTTTGDYPFIGWQLKEATISDLRGSSTRFGEADFLGDNTTYVSGDGRDAKGVLIIYDYASTTKHKNYQIWGSFFNESTVKNNTVQANGSFASTSAISSLAITRATGSATFSNYADNSIRLYGMS